MKREDIEKYEGKEVIIGIPHSQIPNALFFYKGIITNLSEDAITLDTKNGNILITYERIHQLQDISSSKNGDGYEKSK